MNSCAFAWLLPLAVLSTSASAAPGVVTATRTQTPPHVDGALDDPAWSQATPFTDFIQSYPHEGAAPTERTEARVLYDDKYVYVAVHAFDSHPETILRTLGRRDNPPVSDSIRVAFDSQFDRRSATSFSITAGGVKQDGLFTNDIQFNPEWDAVWAAEVKLLPDGWSAEFAIPLRLLRFPSTDGDQLWGISLHRDVPRTHEQIDSSLITLNGMRFVSVFNELRGLTHLQPQRSVELLPYAAARASLTPQFAEDSSLPEPRLLNPSGDVGVDLSTQLSSSLALTATVNPDFGQVEADQVVLNLGTTEFFFPEKRPFFTQGLDLFQQVGSEVGSVPQQLFYSRRIGLDTPILSAVKVVGSIDRFDLGVLDAVVLGAVNPSRVTPPDEDPLLQYQPDRRFAFHFERPLHLGLNNELPTYRPVTRNYFALVARARVNDTARVGVEATDVTPFSERCYPQDFGTDEDYRTGNCRPNGQRAIAVDADVRTSDRQWGAWALLSASQLTGDGDPQTLRDGTLLRPGDAGLAGYVRVGRLAGEGLRPYIQYEYTSPTYDVNQAGFLAAQNTQRLWGTVRWTRSEPVGFMRDITLYLTAGQNWTTDGRNLPAGHNIAAHADALLPGYNGVGFECGYEDGQFDVREISEENIPYQKSPDWYCAAGVGTDPNRMLVAHLNLSGYLNLPQGGVLVQRGGYSVDLQTTFRPMPLLQTDLQAHYDRPSLTARYIDDLDGNTRLFAALTAPYVSLTLRQQVVLSPNLTLQAYAQLFADSGHYGPYYEGDFVGAPVRMTDLRRASVDRATDDDFRDSALNLNVVLRWEYRLGSTLYAVYSRSQQNFPYPGRADTSLSLRGLGQGPATDTVMVKWSYYFDVGI